MIIQSILFEGFFVKGIDLLNKDWYEKKIKIFNLLKMEDLDDVWVMVR